MRNLEGKSLSLDQNEVVGAIFPILQEHANILFKNSSKVFVKFTNLRLNEGMLIIFYVSKIKVLIGSGIVVNIEKMSPEEAWSKYKERIFLDENQYSSYVKVSPIGGECRKMKKIAVFKLKGLKKFKKPLTPFYYMTPAGRYLRKKDLQRINDPEMGKNNDPDSR